MTLGKTALALLCAIGAAVASDGCTVEEGCDSDSDCKGDRICEDGECVSGSEGEGEGEGEQPASCVETGTYCDGKQLYDCVTNEIIVNCNTCQYVGPGTGSEYDTSCKDEEADCTVCGPEGPWNGPGCYFGDGPAVCK